MAKSRVFACTSMHSALLEACVDRGAGYHVQQRGSILMSWRQRRKISGLHSLYYLIFPTLGPFSEHSEHQQRV